MVSQWKPFAVNRTPNVECLLEIPLATARGNSEDGINIATNGHLELFKDKTNFCTMCKLKFINESFCWTLFSFPS